jgi:hypothetical protein
MKTARILRFAAFLTAGSLAVIAGCKYDVADPLWDQPPGTSIAAAITSVEPAQAAPGVNIITIHGTNFTGAIDTSLIHNDYVDTSIAYNGIFFDNLSAEIIQFSSTSIKVRRPNLASDTCTVKVAPARALVAARFTPYKIDPVIARYGSYLENLPLSVVTADSVENLYVISQSDKAISKVTPTGGKSIIATAPLVPTDARIGPDGRLYLMATNRQISVVDVQTGTVQLWRNCPSGKVVKFGDFDAYRHFYTGGVRTDIVIISLDTTTVFRIAGYYATAEILAVRAFNGYLYVAAKNAAGQTPSVGIWRHSIAAGGTLGSKELVLSWDGAGEFALRTIRTIAFATNGTMYIATDSPNPILSFDPATQSLDYFYKGIIPSYCKQFCWGSQTFIYLISGNTSPAQEWTVYRVDMGTTGAR